MRVALGVRPDSLFRQNVRERNVARPGRSYLHPVRCAALGRDSAVESGRAPSRDDDRLGEVDIHALFSVEVNDLPAADVGGGSVTVAGLAGREPRDSPEPPLDLVAHRHRGRAARSVPRTY